MKLSRNHQRNKTSRDGEELSRQNRSMNKDSEAKKNMCHLWSCKNNKKSWEDLIIDFEHEKRNLLYMKIYLSPPSMFSYIWKTVPWSSCLPLWLAECLTYLIQEVFLSKWTLIFPIVHRIVRDMHCTSLCPWRISFHWQNIWNWNCKMLYIRVLHCLNVLWLRGILWGCVICTVKFPPYTLTK